jgi:hypothetical protein
MAHEKLQKTTQKKRRSFSRVGKVSRQVLASLVVVLILSGTLVGPSVIANAQTEKAATAGDWMEDSERYAPDIYPKEFAIKYQIARALLNSYGGHLVRLVLTDKPCDDSSYYGCMTGTNPNWARMEINTDLDYSNLPKTVSHEYAHSLNTGRITTLAEVRLFADHNINGTMSNPDEVLADCASQLLTDFEYPWVVRSYLARECVSKQLALARELLSGRFVD